MQVVGHVCTRIHIGMSNLQHNTHDGIQVVYACTQMYTDTYTHTHIHTHNNQNIHTHMYVCTYVVQSHMCTQIQTHIHTYVHTIIKIHAYIRTYIVHSNMSTQKYIRTRTHNKHKVGKTYYTQNTAADYTDNPLHS